MHLSFPVFASVAAGPTTPAGPSSLKFEIRAQAQLPRTFTFIPIGHVVGEIRSFKVDTVGPGWRQQSRMGETASWKMLQSRFWLVWVETLIWASSGGNSCDWIASGEKLEEEVFGLQSDWTVSGKTRGVLRRQSENSDIFGWEGWRGGKLVQEPLVSRKTRGELWLKNEIGCAKRILHM